ncbi:MAG: exodeoxyribonuclease III [Holosporales bacterium]|nr:exodeoxyribonuclease III [Holosporales bacterium]
MTDKVFSIISWNINSLRARWLSLTRLLEEEKPDILLLQETKIEDKIFPEELLGEYGYNISFYGQKSYNGVALLSKHPLEECQKGFLGDGAEARYIEAVTKGVRVASIYIPNGQEVGAPAYNRKLVFFEKLRIHLAERLQYDEIFVIGGDFNVAPTDQDVYDPKKWAGHVLCTTLERQAFAVLLKEGLTDAFSTLCRSQEQPHFFTWWDYRRKAFNSQKGLRIDHFLLSQKALRASKEGDVLIAYRLHHRPSDHAPIRWKFSL